MSSNFKSIIITMFFSTFLFSREYIAIVDFDAIDISINESRSLTQRLTTEMISLGVFQVLERTEMKRLLDEQKFQYSGCVNMKCAIEIGKMIGARYMVVGSISKLGTMYSIDSRLINVETGESYESADYTHTGDIDYLLVEGMKAIAHKLSGIDYQGQEMLPSLKPIESDLFNINESKSSNGTLIINSTLKKLYSIDIKQINYYDFTLDDLNKSISIRKGKYDLIAKTKYIWKKIEIIKSFEINENELMIINITENDIKKEKKVLQNKIISFISGTILVWITWGLLPYDV